MATYTNFECFVQLSMHFVYLLSVIAVTSVTSNYVPSLAEVYIYDIKDAEFHFKQFIKEFKKDYGEEYEYRFGIFKQNLKKINELNLKQYFNFHGITRFADQTEKEFMDFANCLRKDDTNFTDVNVIDLSSLPDINYPPELDYRTLDYVTEVKDQGACNDCFIFSAVGNIEGQYAKRHQQLVSLSEQEVLDCITPQGCSRGGHPVVVMQQLPKIGGLEPESVYPYAGSQRTCSLNRNQIVARVVTGNSLEGDEGSLIAALNNYGPLAIGISVSPAFHSWKSNRVFKDPSCSSYAQHLHAVLLIGYGSDPTDGPYWIIKNSWGTGWGEQGYVRLARGVGMCLIGQEGVATATLE